MVYASWSKTFTTSPSSNQSFPCQTSWSKWPGPESILPSLARRGGEAQDPVDAGVEMAQEPADDADAGATDAEMDTYYVVDINSA